MQHAVVCEMILARAKKHAEKDEKVKKEKMDAQGFGDNHEYLASKVKYDKNSVEGLLLGKSKNKESSPDNNIQMIRKMQL